jgi:hypothetical protein
MRGGPRGEIKKKKTVQKKGEDTRRVTVSLHAFIVQWTESQHVA